MSECDWGSEFDRVGWGGVGWGGGKFGLLMVDLEKTCGSWVA